MAKEIKEERIVRKDGKNCFVEVLDSAFPIGKVQMDFISYDVNAAAGSRQTANIKIYLDADKFLALADKVRHSGKEYTKYCANHPDFKTPLFQQMGGVSAKSLAARGKSRADGMGISRVITISASKKGYFLTAKSGPGKEDEKGLIVPQYKEPEEKVSIALDHDTLMELVAMTEFRYQAYLAAEYLFNPISNRETPNAKGNAQQKTQKPASNTQAQSKPATTQAPEKTGPITDADLPF